MVTHDQAPDGCFGLPPQEVGAAARVVLFDFGGVLAEEGFRNAFAELAREQGLDAAALPEQAMAAVYNSGFVLGRGSESDFFSLLRRRTGLRGDDAELRERILSGFTLRPGMLGLVQRIKRQGRGVGILSDQTWWLEELDRRTPFLHHFDHVFVSCRMHRGKRDPALFAEVARVLALPGEAIVFVDDDPGNVERARAAGWRAVRYIDTPTLAACLEAAGLLAPA